MGLSGAGRGGGALYFTARMILQCYQLSPASRVVM